MRDLYSTNLDAAAYNSREDFYDNSYDHDYVDYPSDPIDYAIDELDRILDRILNLDAPRYVPWHPTFDPEDIPF